MYFVVIAGICADACRIFFPFFLVVGVVIGGCYDICGKMFLIVMFFFSFFHVWYYTVCFLNVFVNST